MLAFSVILMVLSIIRCDDPVGHGKPIGAHRPSDGIIDIFEKFPTPQEFWDNYMSIGKPCLFHGGAKPFPASTKWTNDYLIKHFGDMEVKLEHKYEKKKAPVGSKGVGRDTIKTFLETYLDEPKYIVSQLPDPMAEDVLVLPFLTCGSYKQRLLESNLWLSSGGSKSMLHKDADNAINCVLNGTKDWMLIHPKYTKSIPVAKRDTGYGGFAVLNVEKVNLKTYSNFKNVRYNHVKMEAGDCLFLPKSYWHQVNSFGIQNLAVTVLFSRLTSFNNSGCENAELKYVPLSESGMVWTYPGRGAQTLGNVDPFELREEIIEHFERAKKDKLPEMFFEMLHPSVEDKEERRDFSKEKKQLAAMLVTIFDVDKKGYVHVNDIKSATVAQLKDAANAIDPDPANTDEYEHFLLDAEQIKKVIEHCYEDKVLKKDKFISNYKKIGGSEAIAENIFSMLNKDNNGSEVTEEVVKKNINTVIELYKKKNYENNSGKFYAKSIKEDNKQMGEEARKKKDKHDDDNDVEETFDETIQIDDPSDQELTDLDNNAEMEKGDLNDEEDDYPEHEPMYQPDDAEEYVPSNVKHSKPSSEENESSDAEPSGYEEVYEEQVTTDPDLPDDITDHKPMYQPEDVDTPVKFEEEQVSADIPSAEGNKKHDEL